MPCFKGIAVSIHANNTPLPEHGMQKQSRLSRISTYIPVPQPDLSSSTNKPEPAKFAISITLLTTGLPIPYSTPKPTDSNPYPKPQFVGGLPPGSFGERGRYAGLVSPYIPITSSENETIAAYIYFDGRAKEEVATLLRPGEETWVNSRWVQVPESEGGGLAEREFLFREVGLERWLNGLDLQGHDAAEKVEKRRQKFERRRRRQAAQLLEGESGDRRDSRDKHETLRYGPGDASPLEAVDDSDSWSDDDDEPPEATGQIKVAMFRVLASGEIKKGEYSPQFDSHEGDEDAGSKASDSIDADVEHTTSFAKPKTLDPKTISTQTVTGIDGPEKPYATFTFFYRGEKQLQKIGVLQSAKTHGSAPGSAKRTSGQLDFSNLGPLKSAGTVGFTAFRDQQTDARKSRKKSRDDMDDSDDEDVNDEQILKSMDDAEDKDPGRKLAPEDAERQGELADSINRIHLKRAHSADPESTSTRESSQKPTRAETPNGPGTRVDDEAAPNLELSNGDAAEAAVGSPMKKARPSFDQFTQNEKYTSTQSLSAALESITSTPRSNQAVASPEKMPSVPTVVEERVEEEEEEEEL